MEDVASGNRQKKRKKLINFSSLWQNNTEILKRFREIYIFFISYFFFKIDNGSIFLEWKNELVVSLVLANFL